LHSAKFPQAFHNNLPTKTAKNSHSFEPDGNHSESKKLKVQIEHFFAKLVVEDFWVLVKGGR